jgi:hypothetical protein
MKRIIFAALVLASPLSAAAPTVGFTAVDMAEAAKRAAPEQWLGNARESYVQAEIVRAAFVQDASKAWATLSPDERAAMTSAIGPSSNRTGLELVWFLRNASTQATQMDGSRLTGYYNPLADVWMLVKWAQVGGTWRIGDAILVPASALSTHTQPTIWTQSPGGYVAALQTSFADATGKFGEQMVNYTPETVMKGLIAKRITLRTQALAQIDGWLGTLSNWFTRPETRKATQQLGNQIIHGNEREAAQVATLPAIVRSSLSPAGVVKRPSGLSVLLISPLYPRLIVTADYRGDDVRQKPTLGLITLGGASTIGADQ